MICINGLIILILCVGADIISYVTGEIIRLNYTIFHCL